MMDTDTNPTVNGDGRYMGLAHLDDLDDYEVADDDLDVRGWKVKTMDGKEVGEVEDLLVDLSAMKVRYLEVELDKDEFDLDDDRRVLIPVGVARLNEDDDVVVVSRESAVIAGVPAYQRGKMSKDHENTIYERYSMLTSLAAGANSGADQDEIYGHEHFDDNAFFSGRRASGDKPYLRRSNSSSSSSASSKASSGYASDWPTYRQWWQTNYRSRPYFESDREFGYYEPAYRFGYEGRQKHGKRSWDEAEKDLQRDWDSYQYKGDNKSTWQDIKDAVRDAWNGMTGDDDSTNAQAGGVRSTY